MKVPELMAPAGNKTMLKAALNAGADGIYFGSSLFNMRARAKNFQPDDLDSVVSACISAGAKSYLVMNTIVYEHELEEMRNLVNLASRAQVDSIICWDLSVIEACKEAGIPFCISTQASISNSMSAKRYETLGASRIVLARECSLDDVKKIRQSTNMEIEVFIHGAMCIAVSGRCFMSQEMFNTSANRGDCIQPCRRNYQVTLTDTETKKQMVLGEDHVLSPKDLCALPFIEQILDSGVDSLKIEGRKRSPEYVSTVVSVYRLAIDLWAEGKLTDTRKNELMDRLRMVYNRGFSDGFFLDIPGETEFSEVSGNLSPYRKEYVGKIIGLSDDGMSAKLKIESSLFTPGEPFLFISEETGVSEIISQVLSHHPIEKGIILDIAVPENVHIKDQVFRIVSSDQEKSARY